MTNLEVAVNPRSLDRRSFLKGVGALGAGLWIAPSADAFALPEDKIKAVRYYSNPGDAQGRQGQPMVNQSTNVVIIETERGLHRHRRGRRAADHGRMRQHVDRPGPVPDRQSVAAHDARLFLSGRPRETAFAGRAGSGAVGPQGQGAGRAGVAVAGRQVAQLRGAATPRCSRRRAAARWRMRRAPAAMRASAPIATPPTIRGERVVDRFKLVQQDVSTIACCCRKARATAAGRSISTPSSIRPMRSTSPRCWSRCIPTSARISSAARMWPVLRDDARNAPACRSRWASSSATNGTSTQLIEQQLIDYARVTLPNVGGISEFMKIIALAETHYVGMIPHFTGPISEAALVQVPDRHLDHGIDGDVGRWQPHVAILAARCYDFKEGKLWPNDRPGLGVKVDVSQADADRRIRYLSRGHAAESAARTVRSPTGNGVAYRGVSVLFMLMRLIAAHRQAQPTGPDGASAAIWCQLIGAA